MREVPDLLTQYLTSLIPEDNHFLNLAKDEAKKINKDGISINSYEAHLIGFFIRQFKCKKFVEIGSLTGYSGLKILENLPGDGHLWSLELNQDYAATAKKIFTEAGYFGRFTILIGKAEENLKLLIEHEPIDGVFIDANKSSYPKYLDWALSALKVGGLIIADNTLLKGVVPQVEETRPNKIITNLRLFNNRLTDKSLFDSILIPTNEGLSIAIKK